jgi:hypothetical protein
VYRVAPSHVLVLDGSPLSKEVLTHAFEPFEPDDSVERHDALDESASERRPRTRASAAANTRETANSTEASARIPMRKAIPIVGMASTPIAGAKGGELLSARVSGR